jgi:hypothetical protein
LRGSHDPRTLRRLIGRFATTAAGNADGRHASTIEARYQICHGRDAAQARRVGGVRVHPALLHRQQGDGATHMIDTFAAAASDAL